VNVRLMAQRETELDARALDEEIRFTKRKDPARSRAVYKLRKRGTLDSMVRIKVALFGIASPTVTDIQPDLLRCPGPGEPMNP
jgi:hypothetical protein